MLKRLCLISAVLCLLTGTALADLSPNPWLEANDEEDLKEVYAKSRKRNHNMTGYSAEGETVIDRSHAYVELPQDEKAETDTGFLGKLSNSLKKKEEAPLITRTTAKRRAAAAKAAENNTESENSSGDNILSGLNFGKRGKGLKLPGLNANGLIQKFERASGINLKSLGQELKF